MDVTDIKSQNIKRILNVLRTSGGTTKNEISAITGLSFSTVSNLCNELKYNNVLVEEKISSSTVGRTPCIQIFNCAGFASVCIDFQEMCIRDRILIKWVPPARQSEGTHSI